MAFAAKKSEILKQPTPTGDMPSPMFMQQIRQLPILSMEAIEELVQMDGAGESLLIMRKNIGNFIQKLERLSASLEADLQGIVRRHGSNTPLAARMSNQLDSVRTEIAMLYARFNVITEAAHVDPLNLEEDEDEAPI